MIMKKITTLLVAIFATTALWAAFTPAAFTVSADGKQVYFSQGNLQYTQSTATWVFAAEQYEMIGTANVTGGTESYAAKGYSKSGDALADKIDLFGWSGSIGSAKWGISISVDTFAYAGDFVDWGKNICNGSIYRTLTYDEWYYLRHMRTNADNLLGVARINLNSDGTQYANGLILLPDSWICPKGVTFNSGLTSEMSADAFATHQTFTIAEWQKLEAAGAVFLPAPGWREGTSMFNVQYNGGYWSSTATDPCHAKYLYLHNSNVGASCLFRGRSVRLVKDAIPYTVTIITPENGTLTADKAEAEMGETVTLTITPDTGYELESITVKDCENNDIAVSDNVFTMPASNVTVSAVFSKTSAHDSEALPGAFSISADKQIYFSPGNLQYTQSTATWAFAENQYDMLGTANVIGGTDLYDATYGYSKSGEALADKIDLFGWSADNETAKWGISTSTEYTDYAGDFVDWGKNIGDGTTYRTLTNDEWNYLLNTRTNASEKKGVARIKLSETEYTNGLILLPDNWTDLTDVTFTSGFASEYSIDAYTTLSTFTLDQWQKLEAAGAVFLPASGRRNGSIVLRVQRNGDYWSAAASDSDYAFSLYFYSCSANTGDIDGRYDGQAVRLVRDVISYAVTIATPENGSIEADKNAAVKGEIITLTVTPNTGYELENITVKDTDDNKIIISEEYTFEMPASNVTVTATFKKPDTKEWVDLGLPSGLKWATCNVGAYAPEIYGDYFAWGETEPKETYWWDNYKYGTYNHDSDYSKLTKYNATDDKITLEAEDDAAVQNWGGAWRMPTDDEWTELRENCIWTWTTLNGVNGYEVKAVNGNSIFLPAAGCRRGYNLDYAGDRGYCWSSLLSTDDLGYTWGVYFNSNSVNRYSGWRYCGRSVRAVQDAIKHMVTIITPENGILIADKAEAEMGEIVTLTITPDTGYELESITVKDCENNDIAVSDNVFTMPASNVTVSAIFSKTSATDNEALPGAFSISADKQIAFSRGNLQYTQSTATWSFAENQYDMIGTDNVSDGALADKIDLFGWSADNETAKWGISTSTDYSDYLGDFVDWGKNIGDGNTYRTLTYDEWKYLLNSRTNADDKKGVVRINLNSNGTQYANGLILLPDSWVCSEGVTFTSGFSSEWSIDAYATYQTLTLAEWQKLEAAGAVFLPASGCRYGSGMYYVRFYGYSWAATPNVSGCARHLDFNSGYAATGYGSDRRYGFPVRLVQDVSSLVIALQPAESIAIYTENGHIVCEQEFQIFDLLGRNVTRLNGSLNGVYIVKVGDKAQKVVVSRK